MAQSGSAIVAAGRALRGVCFRQQGRDKAIGLDCVGVVAAALAEAGYSVRVSGDYAQRGGDAAGMAAMMDRSGLRRIALATAEARPSKPGASVTAGSAGSITIVEMPCTSSATASVAPTSPPPRMITSVSMAPAVSRQPVAANDVPDAV